MIKAAVNDESNAIDYPCLMKDGGSMVVLFEKESTGTVIVAGLGSNEIGYRSVNWGMRYFTKFEGSVILSNGDLNG